MMNKLKEIRFFRGLNQNQLSLMSGVHQSEISKIERDLLPDSPSVKHMKERICDALGVELDEVFSL